MNEEAQLAWQIVETTDTSLFLTGRAGTGKTTFLRNLKERTSKCAVVVAPTGIAALNAGGVTMHSFFQLPFAPYVPGTKFGSQDSQVRMSREKKRVICSIDLLVIDEISMVRADVLDSVDYVLRFCRHSNKPFGGVQLLMIGDLGQLAPVVKDEEWQILRQYYPTPYFFSSSALARMSYAVVELNKVYRQADPKFVDLLNRVRDNMADQSVLDVLNSRYIPDFDADRVKGCIRLTTHNAQAQRVNTAKLDALPGKAYTYVAEIEGHFPDYMYPADERLTLKKDAQVMFVKNDSSPEKRYYNGMIGTVCSISSRGFTVRPKDGGDEIDVEPETWENTRYELNEESKEITEVVDGEFRQFPVKTAWAITIHKSQGLTFDHAVIDASMSFAHGQTYVALSRCRTLEGLVLSTPLTRSAIIRDEAVDGYVSDARRHIPDSNALHEMQRRYYVALLTDLFDFSNIIEPFYSMMRIMTEHLSRRYSRTATEFKARSARLVSEVSVVADKFHQQYGRMVMTSDDYATDEVLADRINKGASYFLKQLSDVDIFVKKLDISTDNKELARRVDECLSNIKTSLAEKCHLLGFVIDNGFDANKYMREKTKILVDGVDGDERKGSAAQSRKSRRRKTQTMATDSDTKTSDSSSSTSATSTPPRRKGNEKVLEKLMTWRREKALQAKIPAYCIMKTESLEAIADTMPKSSDELMRLPSIGQKRVEKYGKEIMEIVDSLRSAEN